MFNSNSNYPPGCSGPPDVDKLWERAWEEVDRMEWDELVELAGPEYMWTKDRFEQLQEAAAMVLYEGYLEDDGNDY